MRLPPVMGLVIEDMQERELQLLLDVVRIADGVVADCSVEVGQCKRTHIGGDARIFLFARGAQAGEILIQDLVEPRRRRSLAGGTMHPHPVANEQMVELPCTEPKKAP